MEKDRNTKNLQKISIEKYAGLVSNMRKAQRQYFRTRGTKYLTRSKELEHKVDEMTAQIFNVQQSLFD